MKRITAFLLLFAALAPSAFAANRSAHKRRARRNTPPAVADASSAAEALFSRSDIAEAKRLATAALKRDRNDARALFTMMEAAALEGDRATELDAALRLCATDNGASDYATIAAGRIRELASRSTAFRKVIPQLLTLAANSQQGAQLRLAMVDAADDGSPEFNLLLQSRESGLLTDWRMIGPMGKLPNVAFDRKFAPEFDGLKKNIYSSRHVEYLQFANGRFTLSSSAPSSGIYYASSKVFLRSGGEWRLRVESPGTLQVFIDGRAVVTRDDRRETQPEVLVVNQHMEGGEHTVMVKFVPSAAPFRIAVMEPTGVIRRHNKPELHAGPESQYVMASLHYYQGDATAAIRELTRIAQLKDSASVEFALAQAWMRVAAFDADAPQTAPERATALRAALQLAPAAAAVEEQVAQMDLSAEHIDDSLQHLKGALSRNPESELALQLLSRIAARFHWVSEGNEAFRTLLRIHPSCATVKDAASYFASTSQFQQAEKLEPQMKSCAPGSSAYASWLASAGRHDEAANGYAALVHSFPLDRDARESEIRERLLAGESEEPKKLAAALAELSPDNALYTTAAADPAMLLDEQRARASETRDFFRAFRRDGQKLVSENAHRKYSGGPAVTLLDDKVSLLNSDGSGAVYIHKIVRVLNRDGILMYGEASIPAGARLIELRTIKSDLSVVEPELTQHKATVSMPALAAGDTIEQEYVVSYSGPDALADHPEAFEFNFGSFAAPILFSKFALIAPEELTVSELNDAPHSQAIKLAGDLTARVWEQDDISQSVREIAMPRASLFPTVRLLPPQEDPSTLRDVVLDAALDASRPGVRAHSIASELARSHSTPEQTAREIYRIVTSRVRSDNSSFATGDATTAEDSFAAGEGNRTAAFLAIARVVGLSTELLMARNAAAPATSYSHPIVLLHFGERAVAVDLESDELPFGSISPNLDSTSALVVPLAPSETDAAVATVKLPVLRDDERSLASGDITFDEAGTFTANVSISMGAFRGAEMREILRGTAPADRPQFFHQLALRLFPGAVDASGSVLNENDLDRPLVVRVTCRSPHFLDFSAQTVDMEQLVPALGLRRMYAAGSSRKFPLYVDSLLFEIAGFRVHLPNGVTLAHTAPDYSESNRFGQYALTIRSVAPSEIEITRQFHVPMQVIPAADYQAFARFANEIDDAERQRLTLRVTSRGNPQAALR